MRATSSGGSTMKAWILRLRRKDSVYFYTSPTEMSMSGHHLKMFLNSGKRKTRAACGVPPKKEEKNRAPRYTTSTCKFQIILINLCLEIIRFVRSSFVVSTIKKGTLWSLSLDSWMCIKNEICQFIFRWDETKFNISWHSEICQCCSLIFYENFLLKKVQINLTFAR